MGGEVNDSVEVATSQKGLGSAAISQIDVHPLGADARDGLDSVEDFSAGIVEVVGEDYAVAAGDEVDGGVRADVAEASGDEDRLHLL